MIKWWEDLMSVEKVTQFPSLAMDSFLANYEFGRELASGKTSDMEAFRFRCKAFNDV